MCLKRNILDGDRFLGVKSEGGYPLVELTHPLSKEVFQSLHLVPKNLFVHYLETQNKKQLWVNPEHPFKQPIPNIKKVDHIHYEQSENILIVASGNVLMFFETSWSNLKYLGSYILKFKNQYESSVKFVVFKQTHERKRTIYVCYGALVYCIRVGLALQASV